MDKIKRRMDRIGMKWKDLLYVLGIDEEEMDEILKTIKQLALNNNAPHTTMQIHKLPLEILIKTADYLNSSDALKLSSCSSQFVSLRRSIYGNRIRLALKYRVESIPQFIKDYTQCVSISEDKEIVGLSDENTLKQHCKLIETFACIRQIDINYRICFDIELLSKLTNIQTLHLDTFGIKDLSPISRFQHLEDLHIGHCAFSRPAELNQLDLSLLSTSSRLRKLSIWQRIISNPAPLSAMIYLQELKLTNTKISDISALSSLVNLVHLYIYGDRIPNIKALKNMKKLKSLEITTWIRFPGSDRLSTFLLDTEPLAYLINLVKLKFNGYLIPDISFVSSLTRLQSLSLNGNRISDLAPLQSLTKLENLELSNNSIQDVSPLSNLIKLEGLNLGMNAIEDISCLQHLVNLKELELNLNQLLDISPLAGLERLEKLNLSSNRIEDCQALAGLHGLIELNISNALITSLAPLENLQNLRILYATDSGITVISPLKMLVGLRELDLSGNIISNVNTLSGLVKLQKLNLDYNDIKDITALCKLTSLADLSVSNNEVFSVWPLTCLPTLTYVCLDSNPIHDHEPLTILRDNVGNIFGHHESNEKCFDIPLLPKVRHLQKLCLYTSGIKDLSSVPRFEHLQDLSALLAYIYQLQVLN
ncbi:hypothetical protein BC833DRAFT_661526 [Globomyces pollinis-pini]|nr:hypothetical protein BC833DRAFT_661526 [Globomyces pollinis-pini]